MDERLSVAYSVLQVIVTTVALLNESILFFNQWIVSPSPSSTPTQPTLLPHPALTSIFYAFSEPLYQALFMRVGIPPWILLFAAPLHLWVCELSIDYLCHVLASKSRQASLLQTPGTPEKSQAGSEHGVAVSRSNPLQRQSDLSSYVIATLPIQSAAASNAALLLFAGDLDSSHKSDNAAILLMFSSLAILFYLGSRYADARISLRTHKTPLYMRQSLSRFSWQLCCLAFLLSLRFGVRRLLDLPAFPVLRVMESHQTQHSLVQETPGWLGALSTRAPTWLPLVLAVMAVPLSIYGALRFRRGIEGQ